MGVLCPRIKIEWWHNWPALADELAAVAALSASFHHPIQNVRFDQILKSTQILRVCE